jgi:hypothetical protein
MNKMLYNSKEIQSTIKSLYSGKEIRKGIVVVAFIGDDVESFLPNL